MYKYDEIKLPHTTWFCAQIETTPLDIEQIIGRIGCHYIKYIDIKNMHL